MPTQIYYGNGEKSRDVPAITSQLPAGYQTLAENNPYANMQYTQGVFDRLAEVFGFQSGRMKFQDEMNNNAQMYNAQLLQSAREEAYNSASAQVQRLREAGINPDIAGNVNPGEATAFDNQAAVAPPVPDGNSAIQQLQQVRQNTNNRIGSLIMGIADLGVKVATFIDTGASGLREILGLETDTVLNNDSINKDVSRFLLGLFDQSKHESINDLGDYKTYFQKDFYEKYPDFNAWWNDESIRARYNGSKFMARRAYGEAIRLLDNPDFYANAYKSLSEVNSNRLNFNKQRASSYYSDSDTDQQQFLSKIVRFEEELEKLRQKQEEDNINTQKKVNEAKRDKADTDIYVNSERRDTADTRKEINKALKAEAKYNTELYHELGGKKSVRTYKNEKGEDVTEETTEDSGAKIQAQYLKGQWYTDMKHNEVSKEIDQLFQKFSKEIQDFIDEAPDDESKKVRMLMFLNFIKVWKSSSTGLDEVGKGASALKTLDKLLE